MKKQKFKMSKVICKQCGNEFETSTYEIKRGKGKFCSKSCSAIYTNTHKNKSKSTYTYVGSKNTYDHICLSCETVFISKRRKTKYCSRNCYMKDYRIRRKNAGFPVRNTIYNEVCKELNISNGSTLKCFICGWDKTQCDVHHIIPKSSGGTNDMSNLTVLCPNHHRLAHDEKIITFIAVSEYKKGE